MSDFGVKVCEIEVKLPHPNADRLELVYLKGYGYQYVTGKDEFHTGQKVVMFPVDSVLPSDLSSRLGLKGDRIKPVRLRGQWSYGLIVPLNECSAWGEPVGRDLTIELGVKKYEIPVKQGSNVRFSRPEQLIALPMGVNKYDIENAGRYPNAFRSLLLDNYLYITEKVEGSHFWASIDTDSVIHVGQRNFEIKQDESHRWWSTMRQERIDDLLIDLSVNYHSSKMITVRGEIVGAGIQGNYYELDPQDYRIYLFEIEVDGMPINSDDFWEWQNLLGFRAVPVIRYCTSIDELPSMDSLSNGKSMIADWKLREGVVIKPNVEVYHPDLGRLVLKIRDSEYLAQ